MEVEFLFLFRIKYQAKFFILFKLNLEGLGHGKLGGNRILVDGNRKLCDTITVY